MFFRFSCFYCIICSFVCLLCAFVMDGKRFIICYLLASFCKLRGNSVIGGRAEKNAAASKTDAFICSYYGKVWCNKVYIEYLL